MRTRHIAILAAVFPFAALPGGASCVATEHVGAEEQPATYAPPPILVLADGPCVELPGDLCHWSCAGLWGPPHPAGCLCVAECPPPSGSCMLPGCSGVLPGSGGACEEVQRAPGMWCASGVGTCDATGVCVLPAGTCDPVGPAPVACATSADCADGNPCTVDMCLGAWCANEPAKNGTACGVGKTCSAGACCAP